MTATPQLIIENIVFTLADDAALQAFALEKWGQPLTIIKGHRRKREISLDSLPLVMVTRPQGSENVNGLGASALRLFYGFMHDDHALAVDQSIEFVDLIRAALRKDKRRGGQSQTTVFGPQVIDEGYGHPEYFGVMAVSTPFYGQQITVETTDGLMDSLGDFLMGADGEILMGAP